MTIEPKHWEPHTEKFWLNFGIFLDSENQEISYKIIDKIIDKI